MESDQYQRKLEQQKQQYQSGDEIHDLPEVFHYWSNKYLLPKFVSVFECSNMHEFYANPFSELCENADRKVRLVSIGSGSSDLEIAISKILISRGFTNFSMTCLDVSENLIEESRKKISEHGLGLYVSSNYFDINLQTIDYEVSGFMANHSLHHVVELEKLFEMIDRCLVPNGRFMSNDMIGRNGHMRWPETLAFIEAIWSVIPDRKKYNHQLRQQHHGFDIGLAAEEDGGVGIAAGVETREAEVEVRLERASVGCRYPAERGGGVVVVALDVLSLAKRQQGSGIGRRLLNSKLQAFDAFLRSRQNFFNNRNITAIVLEAPNHLIGKGTVHAWATVSLYGHAPEMQVSRWGLPMITHLFLNDPANQEVKETFNKSVPSDDIALFSGYIADYTQKMTTYAGSVVNPEEYGKQMVSRLCPITLPYELGTAAAFDLAGFNGRPLGDDVQDVMLTLASNRPIQDGAAPDRNRIRTEFPYFGEPYSKEEQKDVVPWHPRRSH